MPLSGVILVLILWHSGRGGVESLMAETDSILR